jgi:hypothetical protein
MIHRRGRQSTHRQFVGPGPHQNRRHVASLFGHPRHRSVQHPQKKYPNDTPIATTQTTPTIFHRRGWSLSGGHLCVQHMTTFTKSLTTQRHSRCRPCMRQLHRCRPRMRQLHWCRPCMHQLHRCTPCKHQVHRCRPCMRQLHWCRPCMLQLHRCRHCHS